MQESGGVRLIMNEYVKMYIRMFELFLSRFLHIMLPVNGDNGRTIMSFGANCEWDPGENVILSSNMNGSVWTRKGILKINENCSCLLNICIEEDLFVLNICHLWRLRKLVTDETEKAEIFSSTVQPGGCLWDSEFQTNLSLVFSCTLHGFFSNGQVPPSSFSSTLTLKFCQAFTLTTTLHSPVGAF